MPSALQHQHLHPQLMPSNHLLHKAVVGMPLDPIHSEMVVPRMHQRLRHLLQLMVTPGQPLEIVRSLPQAPQVRQWTPLLHHSTHLLYQQLHQKSRPCQNHQRPQSLRLGRS